MYVSSKFIFYDPFINLTLKIFHQVSTFAHIVSVSLQVLQQNSFLMHVVHSKGMHHTWSGKLLKHTATINVVGKPTQQDQGAMGNLLINPPNLAVAHPSTN